MNTPAHKHLAHVSDAPIITVIGDGQLARMMQTEAIEMGCSLRVLAGDPANPAAQVCPDIVRGDYTALPDLRAAADGSQVITFDHEHVPGQHLEALVHDGYNLQPQPHALVFAQDKQLMRQRLGELGLPVPRWATIDSVDDAVQLSRQVGPLCVKATRGGYDGKGVWFPADDAELAELVRAALAEGTPLIAEEKVELTRELSALVARSTTGEITCWPIVESIQTDGVCTHVTAPAPALDPRLADEITTIATTVATALDVTGVLAVELFETTDASGNPTVLINELAMRPHNTGHWTQDGSATSQFNQHLRAITGQPLGPVHMRADSTVMVNILGADTDPDAPMSERVAQALRRVPAARIHLYGKSWRPGRKIGHVNLTGGDYRRVRATAELVANYLMTGRWDDDTAQ